MISDIHALREEVSTHPWRSVALAFAAGGCIALSGSRKPLVRAVATMLTAAMIDVLRAGLKTYVGSWIDARERVDADSFRRES